MKRTVTCLVAGGLLFGSLAACSSDDSSSKTKLTIFIASSLTPTFTTLEATFEKDHPDVDVILSPGSSTTLAQQITGGAPADVIATADQASMAIVQTAGQTAAAPTQFATNTLVIAVPPDNPGNVTSIDGLNSATYVACDVSAPCGAAAKTMLANAGITAQPKSFEPDVATTLTVIESGDVDAGIVYVTDGVVAGDKVKTITIPAADNVTNPYFIATVKGSKESALAQDWVDLVMSQAGQNVLKEAGFGAP